MNFIILTSDTQLWIRASEIALMRVAVDQDRTKLPAAQACIVTTQGLSILVSQTVPQILTLLSAGEFPQ